MNATYFFRAVKIKIRVVSTESAFNLYGLKDEVPDFKRCRRTILEEINDSSSSASSDLLI